MGREKNKQKILIIDDRRDNIVFLANKILKPKGYDVTTAMDGENGLQKALEERPDLIIMDLRMPKMNGLETM
jgi:CheY-like chemotaxis protein